MDAGTIEVVDLRCPQGPKQLLMKIRVSNDEPAHVSEDNLLEIACRDCARNARILDSTVARVLHRFAFSGELIESVIERRV